MLVCYKGFFPLKANYYYINGGCVMVNDKLKSHLIEVVENQLKMNEPVCTKETLNRLVASGFKVNESKEMIAGVLTEEMFYVMKNQEPFNEERYAKKLSLLPGYLRDMEDREEFNVQNR